MIKKSFLKAILICLILVSGQQLTSYAQKVNIIATPATARIYVDGRIKGTGSYTVSVGKKDCVTVEVRDEGYLPEVRTYCNKRGYDAPPKMDNIQLKQDETLTIELFNIAGQLKDSFRNPGLTVKRKAREPLQKATILNYNRMSPILHPLNLILLIRN